MFLEHFLNVARMFPYSRMVEGPTVRMTFSVNTSPFAGKEGKYATSRNIRDRLMKELDRNLALRVEVRVLGSSPALVVPYISISLVPQQ
jgi:predicted membrane GTPase involved in stress response